MTTAGAWDDRQSVVAELARGLQDLAEDIGEAGMCRVARLFLQAIGPAQAGLRLAWEQSDVATLERSAHTLRASVATLGVTGIAEQCAWIEGHAADQVSEAAVDALEQAIAILCRALESTLSAQGPASS